MYEEINYEGFMIKALHIITYKAVEEQPVAAKIFLADGKLFLCNSFNIVSGIKDVIDIEFEELFEYNCKKYKFKTK